MAEGENAEPANDPLNETKSLIILLKSSNPDLQHNALKGLMFCSTACVVATFLQADNLQHLVCLCVSNHKRVEAAALRLLWHLSAQAELKVRLYEENILDKLMVLMHIEDPEVQLACSAILQNIAEYRFEKGGINPNQVKIVNGGILERLHQRIHSPDSRIQFLGCLTLCNLSMNEENSKKIIKSGLLDCVRRFVERSQMNIDMVCHWITLQPHVPLLRSVHKQVQLFGLACLLTLIRNEQYKVEVWKALSMNDGVNTLFHLLKSTDVAIKHLASSITELLQVEEPAVQVEKYDVGPSLKKMCNNSEFSDVKFLCKGGVVYAHKAILASRCDQFHAMFTHFRESQQSEIYLHEIEKDTLLSILEWIYTGDTMIDRKNVVEVLVAAEMYSLNPLKERCEFFLWHYIEPENVVPLYQTALVHHATQLQRVCAEFISRNSTKILNTDSYKSLTKEGQEEVQGLVKSACTRTDASGMHTSTTPPPYKDAAMKTDAGDEQQEDEVPAVDDAQEQVPVPV